MELSLIASAISFNSLSADLKDNKTGMNDEVFTLEFENFNYKNFLVDNSLTQLTGSNSQQPLNNQNDILFSADDNDGNNLINSAEGKKVLDIIREQLNPSDKNITDDSKFADDLGADSLDTVELIMAFEQKFDIQIPDEDAEKITTVGQAIEYIKNRKK
jgi:acyl carrier protein